MSQLNKTETDVEPLIVTVRKQQLQTERPARDLSAVVHQFPWLLNVRGT